jgi:hypothetical protein
MLPANIVTMACCPTPSSKPSSMPARPMAISRRIVDRRRDLRSRLGRARRCAERRPLPPRLHARRRHRRRQGPPVGRHHPRQLDAGRRKAVWISKSDKLIEDAQRDWSALGMERLLVTPLSRFPQGKPITLSEGVLFATYATLRSDERGEKVSRVRQIVEWLGSDFDGVIIFDESHAMQNAAAARANAATSPPRSRARGPSPPARAAQCARRLCLGHRRDHRPQSRLCAAARPLGRRGFPLRDPGRIRRGDRGWRRGGDGSAGARSALARPLHRPVALL